MSSNNVLRKNYIADLEKEIASLPQYGHENHKDFNTLPGSKFTDGKLVLEIGSVFRNNGKYEYGRSYQLKF